jgi:PleD family two-component response regulator
VEHPLEPAAELGQLLAAVRAQVSSKQLPIIVITSAVSEEWTKRLAEGVIDDLVPHSVAAPFWQIRVDQVLRNRRRTRELETLREGALLNAQMGRLTGVYNRESVLANSPTNSSQVNAGGA